MDQEKSEALKTFWLTKDRTPFPELTSTASVKNKHLKVSGSLQKATTHMAKPKI